MNIETHTKATNILDEIKHLSKQIISIQQHLQSLRQEKLVDFNIVSIPDVCDIFINDENYHSLLLLGLENLEGRREMLKVQFEDL